MPRVLLVLRGIFKFVPTGVGLLLTGVLLAACHGGSGRSVKGMAAVPVTTGTAQQKSMRVELQAVGNVESIDSVTVVSRVDGAITKVWVRDGQDVAAGQALIQIDPQPFDIQLRAAQAALARDQAKLENARVRADHGKNLLAQHFISPDDYTQLKTDFESAQATVDADRAARDSAALQLDYATIRAPVAGKLGHIAMQVGNVVHSSGQTSLTTLNVLNPIDIVFAVPEQNIDALRAELHAGKVPVTANVANADGKAVGLTGKLIFIDNAADPTTGTIRLRARFDNRARSLWPGQFVNVRVVVRADPNAIVVPATAIEHGPSGAYVYVVSGNAGKGTAEQRAVQVVRTAAAEAEVVGVKAGERVIVDGQSRVQPGGAVTYGASRSAAATTT